MGDFALRNCTLDDLDQVCEIEAASFPGDAYPKSVFLFYVVTVRDGFIVACQGEKVVGYVIATHRRGQGLIQSVAVSPGFRRRGVGRMLMESAMGHLAKRFERVYLQVDANHAATISFYHGLSFKETGRVLKGYYPNGDDAVEMVRELGGRPSSSPA